MTDQSISSSVYRSKPWATQVAVDADRLDYRMRILRSEGRDSPRLTAGEAAVTHHLKAARNACMRTSKWRPAGTVDWWRGAAVEGAYRNLHSAKISLVDMLPGPEVAALVPDVCARMGAALDRNDPRRTEAEKAMQSSNPAVVRAALKQAMETSYDASDEEYVRLRDFRNIILATAAIIAIFTGILLWAVASSPEAIPLCFSPTVTSSTTTPGGTGGAQTTQVCPSGEQNQPTPGDILIIAGLGAVGGGVGAIVAIRNLRGSSTPYDVPMALAVLKVPSGALTAVIGMLLLAGGFIPGLSNLDSQRQILAYALIFGYAQQIITRLADSQAQTILNRLPSKDPESAQPMVATPAPSEVLSAEGLRVGAPSAPGMKEIAEDGTPVPTPNGSKRAPTADNQPSPAGSSGSALGPAPTTPDPVATAAADSPATSAPVTETPSTPDPGGADRGRSLDPDSPRDSRTP